MNRPATAFAAAVLLCLSAAPPASAAESYDSCTGFIDSVPATISTQGTWCLRADLATAIASGAAITVAANNVTVDCNGFKLGGLLAGASTLTTGIQANERLNTTVRGCAIRGFYRGVAVIGASSSGNLVEDNRFDQIRHIGVMLQGEANRIQRNRIMDTLGSPGMSYTYAIFGSADILDNTVDVVVSEGNATGIDVQGFGNVVRGNVVRNLSGTTTYGVNVLAFNVSVIGNQLLNAAEMPGLGIWGSTLTMCSDNYADGFLSGGLLDCPLGSGNVAP